MIKSRLIRTALLVVTMVALTVIYPDKFIVSLCGLLIGLALIWWDANKKK